MKKVALLATILLITIALPVSAGGKGKPCPHTMEECLHKMVEKLRETGFIGVELDENSNDRLIVTKVIEGSPAEEAGIQEGDELYTLNGIRFGKESYEAMSEVKVPGNTVTCTVRRNGAKKSFELTLIPMPADLMAQYIGKHMMEHAEAESELAKK